MRRTKKFNMDLLWRALRNNIEEIINDLKLHKLGIIVDERTAKKFVRSHKFVVDMKVMGKIIDEFIHKKKVAWMAYYQ